MSIKKSECQLIFEDIFTGTNGIPFRQINIKRDIPSRTISNIEAKSFKTAMKNDAPNYYFKGLLSFAEAIYSINESLYSWATVKLYYAVFYFLRCSLVCRGIALVRAQRSLFYIRAKSGEKFNKCQDHTDHKGTLLTHISLFEASDFLLSNKIINDIAYIWLMNKREEVNYKDITFHDPFPPDFWEQICIELKSSSLDTIIKNILDNKSLMCFQEEYAVLAIPIVRLILTIDDFKNEDIDISLDSYQKELLQTLLHNLSPDFVSMLLKNE